MEFAELVKQFATAAAAGSGFIGEKAPWLARRAQGSAYKS